jgi:alpha-L-fucosidase 2
MNVEEYLNEWPQRQSLLEMSQPAGWWRDGFPLGNGSLGAMPYGRICEERILINHERLWYEGVVPELPDLSELLQESRQLIAQGDFLAANELYHDALKSTGKEGKCAVYHPAADLCLRSTSEWRFKNYRRYLDMAAGETLTRWEWEDMPQLRRSFVSRADDCIVVEQLGSNFAEQEWVVNLELHDLIDAIYKEGQRFQPPIDFTASADGEWLIGIGRYTDPNYKGAQYGVVARVMTSDGASVEPNESGEGLIVQNAERLLLIAKVFIYEPSDTAVDRLKDELRLFESDYSTLLQRHEAKHRLQFDACHVEFLDCADNHTTNEILLEKSYNGTMPVAMLQKMTAYGRYLLVGSSNHSSVPSNLQGIWNGDYAPPWDCFFMINENLLMNYWQALPGGMSEKVLGVFNFYESHLEEYRENARKLFGCRGMFIPALTSPETGLSSHAGSWIVNWISGAGWLCQLFYDYYLFTNDKVFLRDHLLPFMREVALFYEDYFSYDAAGKVVISPSTSPENWPNEFCDIESSSSMHPRLTVNATMDVAVARELLGNLLRSSREFDLYGECYEQWECMLEGLPAYEVNEDGAVREWLDHRFSDNYEHRHLSHIYPVFPGFEISREAEPMLFEAFQHAVDKRGTVGLKDQTGWSLAHMANIRARMGDGAQAFECLETLMQTCVGKNFFTYHNDYRGSGMTMGWSFGHSTPFQIDANMGLTSAVYEMLVQSRPGVIKLLPAVPEQLSSGKITGIRTRASVKVDMEWRLDPFEVKVNFLSARDQTIRVKLPRQFSATGTEGDDASQSKWFTVELTLKADQPTEYKWALNSNQLITY